MKKKFLALVLTLAMVLSLAPVGALATNGGEESQTPEDVICDDTAHSGNATVDGVDSLDKTAKKTGENTYEVTLEVKMHETTSTISQAAATVLVIDVSNSMNDPTCGKEEHAHTDRCYTTYKKCTKKDNPDHWTGLVHKRSGTNCQYDLWEGWIYQIDPILSCKKEKHTHDSSCYPIAAAKEAANSFVDTYAGTVNGASRYLSIVVFGDKASVKLDWTDVSTSNGKNKAKSAIKGLKVDGGTNLEQGLAKAKSKLEEHTVSSVNFKNVVALTDGAPTFYGERPYGSGSSGSETINNQTAETARNLKAIANLYTVCFGAENKKTYWNGPTVGEFLENSIATDSNHAYNADNAGELNKAFEKISQTITSGLSAGTVHDALPAGVSSDAFNGKTTAEWDLSTFETRTYNEGDTTHYTYTKTYTVTIDPNSVDPGLFDENNYYPLNGTTTLKVNVKENGKDTEKTLNFPIPRAKVSYTVTFDSMGGSAVASQKVNRGETANKPSEPTKYGFVFKGWYTDRETTQPYNFSTEVKQNITLYAKWEAKSYGVVYEYVSGTAGKELPAEISVSTGNYAVSDSTTYYAGATVTRKTSPADNTTYDVVENGVTIGTWTLKWDGEETQTMTSSGVRFTGKWTYQDTAKYGVVYEYVSGTTGKELPAEISVSTGNYAVSDSTTYYAGATVTRQTSPADNTTYNVVKNGVTIGTWTLKWEGEASQTMTSSGVRFNGKWTYQDAPAPGEWEFTVNQNFINAKGEKTTKSVMQKVSDTTNQTLQASIPAEMQKNQSFGNPAQNYLYIATETKYHVNDAEKNATDNLADGAEIDLYYYLDVIGGKDEKGNLIDKGDEIPDCYQVTIIYKSSDESRGKISDASLKKEVLTITDKEGNRLSSGKVEITGASAEVTGSRCYFSNWTNDDNQQIANSATLEARTIDAKGGDVYTFTANFGRSSGGSNRPKPPVVEIPDDVPTGLNGKDHYAYVVGYPDGMVYPQKNITRAEVATIFFRLLTDETREANMTKSNGYNDMKDGAWYTCAVSTLSKMGIIKGYEDGSFKPDASISRAEFAAIAARFDPDGDKTPATISEVSSHWAKDEISIAANHGWIKGYEDGSFKPDQKITRAETMTLVNRVLKRLPETKDDLHKDLKTWPDNQNESAWFYLAVQEATNSHYQKLKKDGTHETWESMRETRDWAALEK